MTKTEIIHAIEVLCGLIVLSTITPENRALAEKKLEKLLKML